jgi:hypothetical protein
MEDILVNNITGFYNKLKSVTYSYTGSSVVFIESFESLDYLDKKFHVDKALNVDTTNKTLTLPVKNTVNQEIISVIVEPDSNGMPGNSLNGYKNSDINSLFDGDTSTVYEYEKFTNIFEADKLSLVLTIKLASTVVTNSIYIKLYTDSEITYPVIDTIEVSLDSKTWKTLDSFINDDIGQNDHYIRYIAERTRYVRIKLSQQVAQYVSTGFGIKSRYSIGIRDISVITNEFGDFGDYISIPFQTGKPISNVSMTSDFKSNSDITFLVSANNGGTWLPITPDGTNLSLLELSTGVLISDNLRSISARISMKRGITPMLKSINESLAYSPSQQYQLKYYPSNINCYLGGFVSMGDILQYNLNTNFPYNILNKLYLNSGIKIYTPAASGSTYKAYFNDNSLVISSASTSGASIDYVKYSLANVIKNNAYLITARYIPYYDTIEDDLQVYIGDELVPRYIVKNNIIYLNYVIFKHPNAMHSYIYIDLFNIGAITNDNSIISVNGTISSGINIKYKPFVYTPEMSQVTRNIITLNVPILDPTEQNIIITSTEPNAFYNTLGNTEYKVSNDRLTIVINEGSYSNTATYSISYIPGIDITSLLPNSDQISQLIEIPALTDAPYSSKLTFNYTYQDQQSLIDSKYYSPICKNYNLTLS